MRACVCGAGGGGGAGSEEADLSPSRAANRKGTNPAFSDKGLAKNAAAGLLFGCTFTAGSFCVGLSLWWGTASWCSPSMWFVFGVYICSLSVFHVLEFVMTAIFHPETLAFKCKHI